MHPRNIRVLKITSYFTKTMNKNKLCEVWSVASAYCCQKASNRVQEEQKCARRDQASSFVKQQSDNKGGYQNILC